MKGDLRLYILPSYNSKKENISTTEVSLLNLSIITESKKIKTQHCDKRDAFPFSVVCTSDMDKNIPSNIYFACISPELLKFVRINSNRHSFFDTYLLFKEKAKNKVK